VAFEDILEIYNKDVGDDEDDVNKTRENDPQYNLATKNEESTAWIAISNSNLIEKMSNCAFLDGIGFKVIERKGDAWYDNERERTKKF
jgi:hypothetical protein